MKKFFLVSAVVLAAAISMLAQTNTTPKPADSEALAKVKAAIDKGNAEWAAAWEKGDPQITTNLFAADGKFLQSSGKVIKGNQQILEWQKAFMNALGKGVKVTVSTQNVWLDGDDTAYETGKYHYDYQDEGKPAVLEGKYVVIWKKQKDNSWKVFMDMGVPAN